MSIFVTCEFPDSSLTELLDRYGEFNHEHIRHLRLKDEGLQHIENGVRVVTFTQIDRPIPHTVIYRGTPLGFRYTGQPRLCFKCASPDHVVRDCPKKLPRPETELIDEPEPLTREQITTDVEPEQNANQENTTAASENDNDESDMETIETSNTLSENQPENSTPSTEPSSKRARVATPQTSDTEQSPAEVSQASQDLTTNTTPPLFSPTPETRTFITAKKTTSLQKASDKPTGPRQKKFLEGLSLAGKHRRHLIKTLKPSDHYYKARGLWLQYKAGNYTDTSAQFWSVNDKEAAEWRKLSGTINQDAFAALLHLYAELSEKFDLFPTTKI